MTRLLISHLLKRNGMKKKSIETLQPDWRDENYAYVAILINKELNLFLSRGYEHVSSLARSNRFYINTKIYYRAYRASPPIRIFFSI